MERSDRMQSKQWHEVLASLTPLILGVCVTGIGAVFTHLYNSRQLQINQLNALDKFRPLLVSESSYDREFAYASFAAMGYEELALKLMQVKQDSAGRQVAQSIALVGSGSARAEAVAALNTIPAQVYLQIGSEAHRSKARAIQLELQRQGFSVPGVENVAGEAELPKKTNVRYFNDQDKATAEAIVNILKAQGIDSAYPYRVNLKARPGSLEIWFSADLK